MMTKICTDVEQSNKFIELGIDINTADMVHDILGNPHIRYDTPIDEYHTPTWSLSAVLELMPKIGANEPKLCKRFYIYPPLIRYVVIYGLLKETKEYDNPIDAAFEMVCYLKENGKI